MSREKLWNLLGHLPDRSAPITSMVTATEVREHYVLQTLKLDLNGIELVPAYFARPHTTRSTHDGEGLPVVIYHHAHGGQYELGKRELVEGSRFLQPTPYAEELTARGWAVLAIDAWNFGARHRRTESSLFKEMLWRGQVLWGMMVFDAVRVVDYLDSRSDIAPHRIATMGLSMGSTLAWWLAALDKRVHVCADLCCLTDYDALIADDGLDRHGLYYYVPGLLEHFSASDINALIAPRAHLSVAGRHDPLTPSAGLERIDADLRRVYAEKGHPDAWKLITYDCAHEETPEMRRDVLAWLEKFMAWRP